MALASSLVIAPSARAGEPLSVYAAGSLRGPITQAARAFEAAHPGTRITLIFGASGLAWR